MRRVKSGSSAALLCTCAFPLASYAQDTTDGAVSADTCADLQTREQQLECYEDRVSQLRRELAADGDSNQPETTVTGDAPPVASAAEDPGHTAGEIIANITAIREIEPDAFLITLDNGQTWRQNTPKRYLLRVGAEVHLQPSTWGSSYRLTDPVVGNFIQVKRVQ